MDKSEKLTTKEEIRGHILSKIDRLESIKKSSVNRICANEGTFFDTLEDMKNEGIIDYDDNFIFQSK